jgi:hypothetical protein
VSPQATYNHEFGYKRILRLAGTTTACSDASAAQRLRLPARQGRLWTKTQEELHL